MTLAEKLTTIADNELKVYNAGYEKGIAEQKEESVDWDIIQNYGNRTAYSNGFAYWAIKHLSPKYIVKPGATTFQNAIQGCTELETVDWEKFDLSQVTSFYNSFNSCFKLKSIGIDLIPAAVYPSCWNNTFSGGNELKNIQRVKSFPEHTWINAFGRCYALEEIRFTEDSEIANNISFADSPKLSKESIISICNALAMPEVEQSKTLTFSTDVDLEGKLKETILGEGGLPFAFGDGATENIDDSGISVYNIGDVAFEVYGTSTKDVNINILNTPIEITEPVLVELREVANQANYSDWLNITIQNANGTEFTRWAHYGGVTEALVPGDKILSVDLTIPAGQTYYNEWCTPSLYIDYKYFNIDENQNGARFWNIIY